MNKLLDLLNEHYYTYADRYDDTWGFVKRSFYAHADQCFLYTELMNWREIRSSLVDDVIISKRFWFIAWLIENKHIKPYKAYKDFIDWNFVQFDWWEPIPSVNWMLYDSILCWLAISDNPIELLISILK